MKTSDTQNERIFSHENGLTFHYRDSAVDSRKTDKGFVLYLAPESARQQNQILVEYRGEKPALPEATKVIDDAKIYYHQETLDGGSGGEEVILTLWKPINTNQWVFVEHVRQAETAEDFAPTWALIANAK
jgi:hypothetical protein